MRPLQDSCAREEVSSRFRRDAHSPEQAASLDELKGAVLKCTSQLSLKLRTALELVVFQGLAHKEAASIMRCSANTVSWRVFRAREILRKQLASFL